MLVKTKVMVNRMTQEKEFNIDPSWKGVIKWGGLSLFVAGFMIVPFVLWVLISQQTLPLPAEEFLENPVGPTAFFLLPTIGELLLLPGFMALYFALKDVKKAPMLIATGLILMAYWQMVIGVKLYKLGKSM